MQTSLHRRALPKLIIVALIALAMGVLFMGSDTSEAAQRPAGACSECPTKWKANTYQSLNNVLGEPGTYSSAVGVNSNLSLDLEIAAPSYNFYAVNFFTPAAATLKAGPGNPGADANAVLGDYMGLLKASINISALGQQCNTFLDIPFQLMNATTDNSAGNLVWPSPSTLTSGMDANSNPNLGTLSPLSKDFPPQGGNGGLGMIADGITPFDSQLAIDNDLPTTVDRYPAYLNTLFGGVMGLGGVQPWARYVGINIVSNFVNLNFLIFAPGGLSAVPAPNPSNDMGLASLGYSAVTVLNDPTAAAAPGVTDFCTTLGTKATMYGITLANPCNGGGVNDCLGAAGGNEALLWSSPPGAATGRIRYANPASAGTYLYPTFHLSPRDLDGDGYENGFDTCPYVASPDFDMRDAAPPANAFGGATYDADADGIPTGPGCDVNLASGTLNEDGDNDGGAPAAKEWLNTQDNCPLLVNNDQHESENDVPDNISRPRGGSETDSIGDVCDTSEAGGQCGNAIDDDADTLINDGCPANGAAEIGCLNDANDDNDGAGFVNDGCPSSSMVANGAYYATLTLSPICIGPDAEPDGWATADADKDGWCTTATTFAYGTGTVSLSDPNDANIAIVPEHYALTFPFPIAESGASFNPPPPTRQPRQLCNDGIDNDNDGLTDLIDLAGCKPPNALAAPMDTDGDGYSDEAEVWVGTDPLGRCEKIGPAISTDWPADLSPNIAVDKINISDLSAYVGVPRIYSTSPGLVSNYNQRFDVVPGTGAVPGTWINISDLQSVALGTAPMFGGARMYGQAAACTAHPTYGD